MIIFVSGLIGAGKSTVARAVADTFDLLYYDVDEVKKVIFRDDPEYDNNMELGIPFSDAIRSKLYDAVIKDMETLSNDHQCVVIDETMHKRDMRHRLFDAAERLFGGYFVIWVKADEDVIKRRLTTVKRKGHILKDPMSMHNSMLAEFEGFEQPVVVCRNNHSAEETMKDMQHFLSTVLKFADTVQPT